MKAIREAFVGHDVHVQEDDSGGACVIVDHIEIGENFAPPRSWVGFHITYVEDADVYPHFIDPNVKYIGPADRATAPHPDGNLPAAMARAQTMPGFDLPAISISRKTNNRSDTDTPVAKLYRVIAFLRSR